MSQRKMAEVSIAMANSAAEERAAEKLRNVADDTGDDALGAVITSGTGTDADAGDYLIKE